MKTTGTRHGDFNKQSFILHYDQVRKKIFNRTRRLKKHKQPMQPNKRCLPTKRKRPPSHMLFQRANFPRCIKPIERLAMLVLEQEIARNVYVAHTQSVSTLN